MTRATVGMPLVLMLVAGACVDNSAPGNDREAHLSPPAPPAEVATVGEAIDGVATALVIPQTIMDADLQVVPAGGARCLFRFTRVGLPVAGFGEIAVLKLNDRLVPLAAAGDGRYEADGVTVTVRPIDGEAASGEQFAAELVLQLAGAPDELGYHGYAQCDERAPARSGSGT